MVDGFLWVLDGYSIGDIMDAIKQHVRKNPNIPTPADILAIIDPPQEELSVALYNQISKNLIAGNVFVSDEEKLFRVKFEKQELARVKK